MKKSIIFYVALISITSFIYIGCKKDSDDDATATCSDGIQNQGETGVDCGGPCSSCAGTYYLKYKLNGTLITADSISAIRDTSANPRTLTIIGTTKTSSHLPLIRIKTSESFIGWENGLNVHYYYLSEPQNIIDIYSAAGIYYTTSIATDGIDMFFSKLSYSKGNVISGTFSGDVENSGGTPYPVTEGSFNLTIAN